MINLYFKNQNIHKCYEDMTNEDIRDIIKTE